MNETLTLAELHALLAAAAADAQVLIEVDGLTYQLFELLTSDGRAALEVNHRPAPWEFTATEFAELLHNEFYTTPAVMPVFIRDLLGREFPVAARLRQVAEGVAVQAAGVQPVGVGTQVQALFRTSATRQRIARG